ncbi:MAG: hypothetical protein PHX27_02475 [Candidatus ainarchaeum sp.]|nr:hypothetical protein [Candidatus ainarchaeum sp.]
MLKPKGSEIRKIRSNLLHKSNKFNLEHMQTLKMKTVPMKMRHSVTRSLIDLKRNKAVYDFGPTQLKILDVLIKKSMNMKTPKDLQDIHRVTCNLGLDKH